MKYIITLLLLVSCATAEVMDYPKLTLTTPEAHKYSVGQCFVVFDPESGKSNPQDIVRIERIEISMYIYRWWVYQGGWAVDTSFGIGKFTVFESMTKVIKCPK